VLILLGLASQKMSSDQQEIAKFLGAVNLFKNVKTDFLTQIASRVDEEIFARDQIVFNAGEEGDALYIIKAGSVGVFLIDQQVGLRYEVARLRTGDVFGEMALLTEEKRSATCQAMEPTQTLVLSRKTFMTIAEKIPAVPLGVAQVLAERVSQLNKERAHKQVDLDNVKFDPEVYRMVPSRILETHRMIPLFIKDGVLTIACVDTENLTGLDEVRRIIRGVDIHPLGIREEEYRQFLSARASEIPSESKRTSKKLERVSWMTEEQEKQLDANRGEEIKLLVDMIVSQAVDLEASDIHIEPELDSVTVRYRVSGALMKRRAAPIPRAFHRPIASRIKVLADLDISERRRPQDGRITCKVGEKQYDLRVNTMPTQEGEKIVLRVLETAAAVQPLERLILAEKVCRVVTQMVLRPHGIVFVCGPTGSGKTTTLYSAVGVRRREDTNIVTVEDPVEYGIPGITQVNVNPDIGLTFASVLRAMLRQDPNVIMVGETRDSETGEIALEAGLTGHLVLTSLHTSDAIGAIQRLREMDLENYAIGAALVGVISQRLVRRLCPVCAQDIDPSPHMLEQLEHVEVLSRDYDGKLKKARGCDTCSGSGYRGRVGVFEILVADDGLKQGIIAGADQFRLKEIATAGAYVPLHRYSNYLLTAGITTPEEILAIHAGSVAR
jgi:type II secretory ATPase GspE/PulE/Tfp pilus assembly ATPase PilB-like protein